ncbi:unnamed protein product [Orchesella dallaii]|uniref:CRAL-TRIO domain-containing protein n=1 Tax=Orchesella dallaii TaxID=48710 RepID=A0ABP1QJA2_9HEXA
MGLKKTPTVSEGDLLKSLRTLVEDNEDIVKSGIDINDVFLMAFIKGRKHNVTVAYKTIQKYVDVRRRKYVQFFSKLSPMSLIYMYDLPRFMAVLKERDPRTGCLVVVLRPPKDLSAVGSPFEDVLSLCALAIDEFVYMDEVVNNGLIVVACGEGFGLTHMKELTPGRMKMTVDITYNAYPFYLKQVHVVQCSTFFNATMNIVKPFLPRKVRERIVIHKTLESFHEAFSPDVVPSWLGGNRSEEDDWEVYDYTLDRSSLDRTEYYEKLAMKLEESIN